MNGGWRHTVHGPRGVISSLAITHGPTGNRMWKRDQEFKMMLLRVAGSTLSQGFLDLKILLV